MSQHGCPERLSNRSKGFQEDGPSQPTMEVLVETLTGTAFEMTVSPSDTIFAIKSKIFRVEGIPVSQQHLLYNLKELEDSSSLHEHAISDGARLRLVLGMCGGPITTRRLPPPPGAEPWRDIERLLDEHREEGEWGGNGCKVTVLVFREGERVNMLRVRENRDGSYSPLDHAKYSSSLTHLVEQEAEEGCSSGPGARRDNAVTMGKMLDLRRRMETLSLRRRPHAAGDKPEIQKTRSEEILSVPSLLDDSSDSFTSKNYSPYEAEDTFAPLYDGNYTRYDYDCSFTDRYSLLPPIGTRTDSEPSVQDAGDSERLSTLAGSILVKGREDESILEECLDPLPECRLRQNGQVKNMAPIQAAEYGPLVWRSSFGSGGLSPLPLAALGAPQHASASALHVRPRAPRPPPPLTAAASAPGLDRIHARLLPALSRHRPRSQLHLSDERLELEAGERRQRRIDRIQEMDARRAADNTLEPPAAGVGVAGAGAGSERRRSRCQLCRRRLSIATSHTCRCGGLYCAPHRYQEVHGCAYDYKAAPAQGQAHTPARLPDI